MKGLIKLGLLCMAFIFASGCAKIPKPIGPDDTLLVGKIELKVRGYHDSAVTINGKHNSSIEITFRNMETRKTFKVWSKQQGVFYATQLEPGVYIIDAIGFKERDSIGSWTALTWERPVGLVQIIVEKGAVANLGSLLWLADKTEGEYGVFQTQPPEEFYQALSEKFPDSKWMERPWNHVFLH